MPSPIRDRDQVRQLVNIDLPSASKTKVLEIITESGAILDGHFSFRDHHSQHFLRFRGIGNSSREYCDYLASLLIKVAGAKEDKNIPLKILSAESAGFFLGHAIAKLFGGNMENKWGNHVVTPVDLYRKPCIGGYLRSGQINPGDRVVVVSDVDHTGESLDRLIKLARRRFAIVDTAMVFATCNDGEYVRRMIDMGVKPHLLVEFKLEMHKKENCPLCQSGVQMLPASEFV